MVIDNFVRTFNGRAFTSFGGRPGAILLQWTGFPVFMDVPAGLTGGLSRWPSSAAHLKKASEINALLGFPPTVVK